MWWIAIVCVLGLIGLMLVYVFVVRSINHHKKVKFKIPHVPTDEQMPKESAVIGDADDGILYDQDDIARPVQHVEKSFKEEAYEDELIKEEELRYREMLRRQAGYREERDLPREDDFETFRKEHCYSTYFTDVGLLKQIRDMPQPVKQALFGDIFAKVDIDKIKFSDDV